MDKKTTTASDCGSPPGEWALPHPAVLSPQVLEQARVEVPLFPFSIVQFSFEGFSPALAEEMNQRVSGVVSTRFP